VFEYIFLQYEQPAPEAWMALCAFADQWNQCHVSRFDNPTGELQIILREGVDDPELSALEEGLSVLERAHAIIGMKRVGPPPDYSAASLEQAPYILLVGEGCPPGLLTNEAEAFGSPSRCPRCGAEDQSRDRPLIGTLRIDEDLIDSDSGVDPDFLNLENGGRLVSRRFADALQACAATSFRLIPLQLAKGDELSRRYSLLCATHVVLEPCAHHAPREKDAICSHCGAISVGQLERKRVGVETLPARGGFHVPSGDLDGISLFSRHRFGMSDIYFARGLYLCLQSAGARGLTPSSGIDTCDHDGVGSATL
jgi:hypothetical protein